MIAYSAVRTISTDQFINLLNRSTLAARRPVDDPQCVDSMLEHADILITAWDSDSDSLIGVARSVTDYSYCCYLSDLAVDANYQKRGIGKELMRRTRQPLGPRCMLILLSAPAAMAYYPRVGFEAHNGAWVLQPSQPLLD